MTVRIEVTLGIYCEKCNEQMVRIKYNISIFYVLACMICNKQINRFEFSENNIDVKFLKMANQLSRNNSFFMLDEKIYDYASGSLIHKGKKAIYLDTIIGVNNV